MKCRKGLRSIGIQIWICLLPAFVNISPTVGQQALAQKTPGQVSQGQLSQRQVRSLQERATKLEETGATEGTSNFPRFSFSMQFGKRFQSASDPTTQDSTAASNTSFGLSLGLDTTMAEKGNFNLKMPTLGGKQVWTDHRWWYGWRVQENLLTGHWRLLDDRNVRHAWGSRESCEEALAGQIQAEQQREGVKETPEEVVILLHGLMRSSDSMQRLESHLRDDGFQVAFGFGYASTRSSIANHAQALREVVAGLPGKPKLYFSGHSMGNIVLRHAIGDWQRMGDQETLDRIQSVVMLGPPNQGAAIARRLAKTGVFGVVTGAAGMELGPAWDELEKKLATPTCRFGIVMGDIESWARFNPLLDGPSDLIVTVEEAKLDGAAEMLTVPDLHSFLMDDKKVQQAVARFFRGGNLAESNPGDIDPGEINSGESNSGETAPDELQPPRPNVDQN